MSLEDSIAKLTAALDRNSAILEKGIGAASTAKAAAAAAPSPAKPAATPAKPAAAKPAAAKVDDLEKVKTLFGDYLAVKKGPEKDARTENVKAILAHFGAKLVSEIDDENRAAACAYLEQFKAGETPDFMNEGATEEEEAEGSLL